MHHQVLPKVLISYAAKHAPGWHLACRLYDGYTLRCKYKGHTNRNTQVGHRRDNRMTCHASLGLLLRRLAPPSQQGPSGFIAAAALRSSSKQEELLCSILPAPQIRASFSPGGDYITCGSDDGWVRPCFSCCCCCLRWHTKQGGLPAFLHTRMAG